MRLTRRSLLAALLLVLLVVTTARAADGPPPILFVHGNGDSAAIWLMTIWRFESNGYEPSRLFAIDHPRPTARSDDTKEQENRSSTADQLKELAAKIAEIRAATGQARIALVGISRGGYSIRNYVKHAGGAANVSHVVLGGVPNAGVFATTSNLNNEFNGLGPFLQGLNAGDQVPRRSASSRSGATRTTSTPSPTAGSSAGPASRRTSRSPRPSSAARRTSCCPASTTVRPPSTAWRSRRCTRSSPAASRRRSRSSPTRHGC